MPASPNQSINVAPLFASGYGDRWADEDKDGGTEIEQPVGPLAEIFDLHMALFLNSIAGVSGAHAAARVLPSMNSIAFVVAHVVDARHFAAKISRRAVEHPLEAMLGRVERIEQVASMPSLTELRGMWGSAGRHFQDCLQAASADLLLPPSPQRFSVRDRSLLDGFPLLAQHESYHVGRLGFVRQALG